MDVKLEGGMSHAHDDNGAEGQRRAVAGAQTLERGLAILELLVEEPMTIQEAIQRTGMNRGVVYRLVSALTAAGYLTGASDGRFFGGTKLLRLAQSASTSLDIVPIADAHLSTLAARTGLSGFLARRDGDFSVHLLRSAGSERIAVSTQPGTRRLLPETGLGKTLMLDDPPELWDRLFARVDGQSSATQWRAAMRLAQETGALLQRGPAPDHINSVCAAVRNASGKIVGAINIAAAAQYLGDERMSELVPVVVETAQAISRELGYQG
jgi:DNA-binding IclR family transcriptional regulator